MIWQAICLHADLDCARVISACNTQLPVPCAATTRFSASTHAIAVGAGDGGCWDRVEIGGGGAGVVELASIVLAAGESVIPGFVGSG